MPLVSVVVASLNDLSHLRRAVGSVLEQRYFDIELLIMDGASRDGTREYLRTLSDPRVRWRCEKDKGLVDAWNKALARAHGEWVLFLGADDFLWDCDVIARAAPYLTRNDSAMIAFGEVRVVAEYDDTVVQTVSYDKSELLAQLRSPRGLGLPHQGFFHRRKLFAEKDFDTTLHLAADYEVISRFTHEGDFLHLPIGPVAAFRMGGISTDPWASLKTYLEFRRIHRSRGRPFLHGAWQISKAYMKVVLRKLVGAGVARGVVNASRAMRHLPPY